MSNDDERDPAEERFNRDLLRDERDPDDDEENPDAFREFRLMLTVRVPAGDAVTAAEVGEAVDQALDEGPYGGHADWGRWVVGGITAAELPGESDIGDGSATQAIRDALMPWACGTCGGEASGPGGPPDHLPDCALHPDAVADAKRSLAGELMSLIATPLRYRAEKLLEDLLDLAEDGLDEHGRAALVAGVLNTRRASRELTDDVWEVVPGPVMTVDARSADGAVRAALAERDETEGGKGYVPDPNPVWWTRRAGTRGPWHQIYAD